MRAYITAIFRKISDWINPKQPEVELYPIKDSSGRVVQLVDRHYKEHLESTAPNPSQAELDEMLGKADRVRILEGGARYFAGWHFNSAKPGERTLIPLATSLFYHKPVYFPPC